MTVRYTVIEGEVMSELRSGTKRDYVPDPLGSTVALLDNTQSKTDTFGYWPYGEVAARTGTTPTPFQYVGTLGYFRDSNSRDYVRARYLDKGKGRWITEDPIGYSYNEWNLMLYCDLNPASQTDYTGLIPSMVPVGLLKQLQIICRDISMCHRVGFNPFWFRNQVKKGGPWDFKKGPYPPGYSWRDYENFGNFHYGVVGAACGFSKCRLQNEAGKAQGDDHPNKDAPSEGYPGWGFGLFGGKWPYGDDPNDSRAISRGYDFYLYLQATDFSLCRSFSGWSYYGPQGPMNRTPW